MYNRLLLLAAAACTMACVSSPPPNAPAPVALTSSKPPSEVIQQAAAQLAAIGFEVTQSDVPSGSLTARRVRTADAHGADVTCRWRRGSMAGALGEAAYTVSVNARQSGNGTAVQIASSIHTDYSKSVGPFSSKPASDTDCVSAGVIEQRLADAVR